MVRVIRYGSVCSGIEAASVAWRPLGWTPAFFAEIDPFPSAVLAARFPSVPNLGDFTEITEDAGPIDLLVGGTPCQSFSVAGRRLGLDDPRGNLAIEFLRLARRLRPRWLVWENVPGVLSSNRGRDFGAFLGLLGELGYGFAYRVLDAQYFGVAQRRRRVFVVGHLGDWRRAVAVLFERESLSGHPAPRREAGSRVAASLEASTGRRCGMPNCGSRDGALVFSSHGHGQWREGVGICTARDGKDGFHAGLAVEPGVAHTLRADGFDASEDGTGRGIPLVPVAYQCHGNNVGPMGTLLQGNGNEAGGVPFVVTPFDTTQITSRLNRSLPRAGDPDHPRAAGAHPPAIAFDARQSDVCLYGPADGAIDTDGGTNAIAFQERGRDGGRSVEWQEESAYSLNAPSGGGRRHEMNVATNYAVRRLTPRECERLQGFPDDWTAIEYRGKPAADGPRYKAIGNSMAVPCMAWIGERIRMVEDLTWSA